MNGLFITGTDTDAGKTTVTAALLRALLARGVRSLAVKPVQTGCRAEDAEAKRHEAKRRAEEGTSPKQGCPSHSLPRLSGDEAARPEGTFASGDRGGAGPEGDGPARAECALFAGAVRPAPLLAPDVACYEAAGGGGIVLETYEPACSPHLAAKMAGRPLTAGGLLGKLERNAPRDAFLLVEGAGGVYVPLNDRETMLDFMAALDFPVLLVVGNKLGCINHALLSLDVLQSHGLRVFGMVLNRVLPETHCDPGSGPDPDVANERRLLRDNRETLARMGRERGVPLLAEIPYLPGIEDDPASAWPRAAECLEPALEALRPLFGHLAASGEKTDAALSEARPADASRAASAASDSGASALGASSFSATGPSSAASNGENARESVASATPQGTQGTGPSDAPEGTGAGRPGSAQEASSRADALLAFDRDHLWHPYTSALNPLPVREAVSASGVRIRLRDGRELVDGMSSWWCAIHGYGHPVLMDALRRQSAKMAHVMFGGLTHEPAVELARRLLPLLPGNLRRIFYADSGSVSVEVALKMAVQYWASKGRPAKTRFLTPRGGYHGDTQGAMSVCDPVNGMHTLFTGILPKHVFAERPSCRFDAPFDPESLRPMRELLERGASTLAAVILEPIVQGAGGMWFYHPDYLRGLRKLCDEHEVLLIVDEIATGFGRTGKMFASEWAGLEPDILCLGKALTGGTMTLAATVASENVARGIEEAGPEQGGGVFMHGPTFMGNPLACAVACTSLDILNASPWADRVEGVRRGLAEGLAPCREFRGVRDVRVLGAIGVVEVDKPVNMARLQDFFVARGVWVRPFNRNVYLMPPYCIEPADLRLLTSAIVDAVREDYR